MPSYLPGSVLGRNDLNLFFQAQGEMFDPFAVGFDLFFLGLNRELRRVEVLIPPLERRPVNPAKGEYYASVMIPLSAEQGEYGLRWRWQPRMGQEEKTALMYFHVRQD